MRLVLGTADFKDDDVTPRILDRFEAAGGQAIDVANVYGEGESERAVGKWLRARTSEHPIVLYGKGCHAPYCSPDLVGKEVEEALALLGVERLDVFMLHRDDAAIPAGEVLAWASLAMGYFAGREASSWESPENEARRSGATTLANELGTTAHALALAYILHQPYRVRPAIGTRFEAHLGEALSATRVELTDDQLTWLETG